MSLELLESVEDFANNPDFIDWCISSNPNENIVWKEYLRKHPRKVLTINEARRLVISLRVIQTERATQNYEQDIWNEINKNIEEDSKLWKQNTPNYLLRFILILVVFILCGICVYHFVFQDDELNDSLEWKSVVNNNGHSETIYFEDGSLAVLEPYSRLSYPKHFNKNEREVLLQGQAFFDIERDTTRPFLVYANKTITKVLGTSFIIDAFEGEETVEVDVISGKVAVYANVKEDRKKPLKQITLAVDENISIPIPDKKLVITKNQKVIFNKEKIDLSKTISTNPKVPKKLDRIEKLVYRSESVVEVLHSIESIYGIEIDFDEYKLKDCTITTTIGKDKFFEELEMITQALGLDLVQNETKMMIRGDGC